MIGYAIALQEVGKENLFIFGMDESEVPAWREGERAEFKEYDPRFITAIDMIRNGTFGDKEYFEVSSPSVRAWSFFPLQRLGFWESYVARYGVAIQNDAERHFKEHAALHGEQPFWAE